MVSELIYELCLPVLSDKELPDEDKTEKLLDLLRKETSLSGTQLENAVLNVLWHHRDSAKPHTASPPLRHTVIRRASPAPWQIPRVASPRVHSSSTGSSPAAPPGFPNQRPSFARKTSAASPFTSPRPSPRLALAQPIPHSPNLNSYAFADASPVPDIYGDYGSDTVDWLVNDDAASATSSTGGTLSAAAPEWMPQPDMSPYDILRSVLGEAKTDEEIERALEMNSYDIGATVSALTEGQAFDPQMNVIVPEQDHTTLVGKSMDYVRPVTPTGQARSTIPCKYWLAHGQCLRADCRFSHDLKNHVCKYWLAGTCFAGDGCPFSHDPSATMTNLNINDGGAVGTPPLEFSQPMIQLQDQNAFPSLQPGGADAWQTAAAYNRNARHTFQQKPQYSHSPNSNQPYSNGYNSRPHSRPTSRHQHRDQTPSAPSVDDPEAFPTLASLNAKGAKKHHGKRGGHGHGHSKEALPSSLADVVRLSPSPAPGNRKNVKNTKALGSRENSTASQSIPAPKNIPWLETGGRANQQYLKYRQEAIKHGSVRNKFLQSAAQAWNRNDARAAKALSLRGQTENDAMRKAHREAARCLYEDRNKHLSASQNVESDDDSELYIDLHGLHPDEAVEYLDRVLSEQRQQSVSRVNPQTGDGRIVVYAITGTGHHSKNGKDKVGKAVRGWLNEWRYVFREFSVPGDRGGNVGGVLGIDAASLDRNAGGHGESADGDEPTRNEGDNVGKGLQAGKVRVLRREDVESPKEATSP